MKPSTKGGDQVTRRRKTALKNLETRLAKGMKMTRSGEVELTDNDVNRMKREMDTLKSRLHLGN